jgi:hypothetical protein
VVVYLFFRQKTKQLLKVFMRRRTSSTIPFGYAINEANPEFVVEIPEELEALNKVLPMIKDKALSLREGAMWLQHITGRKVSHMGLKKIAAKHG